MNTIPSALQLYPHPAMQSRIVCEGCQASSALCVYVHSDILLIDNTRVMLIRGRPIYRQPMFVAVPSAHTASSPDTLP